MTETFVVLSALSQVGAKIGSKVTRSKLAVACLKHTTGHRVRNCGEKAAAAPIFPEQNFSCVNQNISV